MTIASQTSKVSYLGNGSTRVFSIPFYFVKNSDLAVVLRRSDGGEIRLTETSDYVLSGAKDPLGGSLETSIAPAQDEVLAVLRDPGIVQETDYQENDAFPAETHEAALDLLTMICQGLDEKLARAVKLKVTSPASGAELPDPEPGRMLGWDASGQGLENKTLAGAGVLETPVPVADGGTGASAADAALANLGLSGFMRGMAGDQDAIEVLDRLGVTSFARTLMDDQDAQEARQTLGVDQGADEIRNLLVAEAMRRAVGDAEDGREYLGDGWMDPLADADEVDAENSSGYEFQSADTGYLQPIPAAEGVDKTLDYALEADYGQEDVKGSITTLTVDTEDTSGHFDAAANAKVQAGCRMVIDGTSYTITAITDDGTGTDEVVFDGTLSTGAKTVTAVYGTVFDSGLVKLSCHQTQGTTDICTGGTATDNGHDTGCEGSKAFDDSASTHWYKTNQAVNWLAYELASARVPWKYRLMQNYDVSAAPKTWTFEGWNGVSWDVLDTQSSVTNWTLNVYKDFTITGCSTAYSKFRLNITAAVNNATVCVTEMDIYALEQAAPTNQFYTVTGTIAAAGITDINSAAVTETANGQSVLFAFSFDDGVTFKAWDGDSWETVSLPTSDGAGWMTPATVEGVADADWPVPTGDIKVAVALKTTSASQNPEIDSVVLSVDTETTNAVIQFTGFTAEVPDLAKVVLVFEAVDDVTLDTDLAAFVRRGQGEFIQADLEMDSQYDADKVLVAGDIDLSAGSGSGTVLKLTTHNNKRLKVYAASCTFKEA